VWLSGVGGGRCQGKVSVRSCVSVFIYLFFLPPYIVMLCDGDFNLKKRF
jgi:hypothetical protein